RAAGPAAAAEQVAHRVRRADPDDRPGGLRRRPDGHLQPRRPGARDHPADAVQAPGTPPGRLLRVAGRSWNAAGPSATPSPRSRPRPERRWRLRAAFSASPAAPGAPLAPPRRLLRVAGRSWNAAGPSATPSPRSRPLLERRWSISDAFSA